MGRKQTKDLETTYRTHHRGLLSWAARATRSLADAEDLVQEAYASALAEAESLDLIDDLAAWLFTTLRNKVRDLWRHREVQRKAGETAVSEDLISEIVADSGIDPLSVAVESELQGALYEAIEDLPEEQRHVIEAQVLDGLTFRELAEASGISPDTLAARKRSAIKRLSAALREWAGA
ncbi:MAG TPA: sigma-70 family RNA polymerase sigma factor [Rectinemataceae bacterium]|nr:sigma-70 family RNA polymerase sigma factor [Rectinemataceae bacterium]